MNTTLDATVEDVKVCGVEFGGSCNNSGRRWERFGNSKNMLGTWPRPLKGQSCDEMRWSRLRGGVGW